jgi:hypothetical protein
MRRMQGVSRPSTVAKWRSTDRLKRFFFAPGREIPRDRSRRCSGPGVVFGPNIQAQNGSVSRVWPGSVRQRVPDAQFTIIDFSQPTAAVKALATKPGDTLYAKFRDLRGQARSHALAVLPLVSAPASRTSCSKRRRWDYPSSGTQSQRPRSGCVEILPDHRTQRPRPAARESRTSGPDPARPRQTRATSRAVVLEHDTWRATALEAIDAPSSSTPKIRVGFVHAVMQVAGPEVLVAETISASRAPHRCPVIFCDDNVAARWSKRLTWRGRAGPPRTSRAEGFGPSVFPSAANRRRHPCNDRTQCPSTRTKTRSSFTEPSAARLSLPRPRVNFTETRPALSGCSCRPNGASQIAGCLIDGRPCLRRL